MIKPGSIVLLGFFCLLALAGCEPVGQQAPTTTTDVVAPLVDIPAAYGELESVTTSDHYPGWFQLWFEDEAGTIRIVRIHMVDDVIHREVKVIPRSGLVTEEVPDEG